MKWEVLTEQEKQLLRERGEEPEDMMVSRIGTETLVFQDLKTRKEICIRRVG